MIETINEMIEDKLSELIVNKTFQMKYLLKLDKMMLLIIFLKECMWMNVNPTNLQKIVGV